MFHFYRKKIGLPLLIIFVLIALWLSFAAGSIALEAKTVQTDHAHSQAYVDEYSNPAIYPLTFRENIKRSNHFTDREIVDLDYSGNLDLNLHIPMVICGVLSACVTFFAFAFFCNRKQAEYTASLPYKRKSLFYTGMVMCAAASVVTDVLATLVASTVYSAVVGWFPTGVFTGSLPTMLVCSIAVVIVISFSMAASSSWLGTAAATVSLLIAPVLHAMTHGLHYGTTRKVYAINGIELSDGIMAAVAVLALLTLIIVSGIVVSHRRNNDASSSFAIPLVGWITAGFGIACAAASHSFPQSLIIGVACLITYGAVVAVSLIGGAKILSRQSITAAATVVVTGVVLAFTFTAAQSQYTKFIHADIDSDDVVSVQIEMTGSHYALPGVAIPPALEEVNETVFRDRTLIESVCTLYNLNGHATRWMETVPAAYDMNSLVDATTQITFGMRNGSTRTVYVENRDDLMSLNAVVRNTPVLKKQFMRPAPLDDVLGIELLAYGPMTISEISDYNETHDDKVPDEGAVAATLDAERRDDAPAAIEYLTTDKSICHAFLTDLYTLFDQCSEDEQWLIYSMLLPNPDTTVEYKNIRTVAVTTRAENGFCAMSEYVVPDSIAAEYDALIAKYMPESAKLPAR